MRACRRPPSPSLWHLGAIVMVLALLGGRPIPAQQAAPAAAEPFDAWLTGLIAEARDRGFDDGLLDAALAGLEPLERVIQSDRSQAELTPGFEQYRSRLMNDATVRRGRELAGEHASLLSRIEQEYGVQRRFVLAIWGIESRFGSIQGRVPVFQALATLAWEPRRAAFFRGELFNALTMVQRGHIDVPTMTGSWAGAMGQTQFMPSSYLEYAQDFDGDGRRNIWTSTPDALASIANYLRAYGWTSRETWGREVVVPAPARAAVETIPKRTGGCAARRDMTERRPLVDWDGMGVRLAGGSPLPAADLTAGLVDVGERRFLVYPNYDALLAYNCSHYYALTVTLLAERLR